MRHTQLLIILPLACVLAGPAAAQEAACTKQLKLDNEIQMESRGPGPSLVPVEIDGTRQNLVFATAGTATQISEDTAKSLGLAISPSDLALYDARGNAHSNKVTAKSFAVGTMQGSNVELSVAPPGGRGLFSLSHMLPFDIDVDFGTDKLRFFSQDHCPGGVLYWQASVVGVLPMTIDKGRVTVPVEIDGKALTGVIDTAAMGLRFKDAVADKVLGLGEGMTGKSHTGMLRLNQLGLRNIKFDIVSNGAIESGSITATARNRSAALQNALAQPEVVIGMDLLRKLHLYMAFGEKKLYITPASARPAPAAAPPQPAAN